MNLQLPIEYKNDRIRVVVQKISNSIQNNSIVFEILTIGREILDGRVIDTNSSFLAQELKKRGLTPRYAQKVDDDPQRMIDAFSIAQKRSTYVLVTGGLGPTQDDLSIEIFAQFIGKTLSLNKKALAQVKASFKKFKRPMAPIQKKQALLIEGCHVLTNTTGTAPGMYFHHQNCHWFFMPGVPREMYQMFQNEVLRYLPNNDHYRSWMWRTHFTSEGELQSRLTPALIQLPKKWEISFRTRFPENHVQLFADISDRNDSKKFVEITKQISHLLSDDVFESLDTSKNFEDPMQGEIENIVVNAAIKSNFLISTVESCTGGLIAHRLTNISGASSVFFQSQITYDNLAKIQLGVSKNTISKQGAVSEACAREMAESGLHKMKAAILKTPHAKKNLLCIATTGIAGPSGGSLKKPVGLCYIATSHFENSSSTVKTRVCKVQLRPHLDRQSYKLGFSQKALDELRNYLLISA